MTVKTTYTQARANLAKFCNEVVQNRETVIIRRRAAEDVALIAADELAGLMETAHLLRSPKNAERLLTALARARGETIPPKSLEELRREIGLEETA
ncbi:MAG: type II toxin-antitoxin system prevent-host-death family antitoxin [Gammaproteobacteria bacterium]|nr:type II toxin-antitoxin system prevent-host-death family antitoxin [Gammaproteobacteria bacterium]MBA3731092.1 type II toxin-antitoxin system prevent-host-death family antitoxin [Gammaproteobacteria bacterium]